MNKKKVTPQTLSVELDSDVGQGLGAVAEAISSSFADEFTHFHHIENIAENLGELSSAMNGVANAIALSAIAQHGSNEDRDKAVSILKNWFDSFRD
jgi:predicted transcriptional regulator